MVITLPALEFKVPHSSKNILYHKIHPEFVHEFESVQINQDYIILESERIKCCITHNENKANSDCNYILLTKKKISGENLESNSLHFKAWLKHPKLKNYNPSNVHTSWKDAFKFIEENSEEQKPGLRAPQIGAIHSVLGHFRIADEIGTVVLPTGTGKTETMLSLLIAHRCERVLVTVPSDALRDQIAEKFMTLGYLQQFGIVSGSAVTPIVGVINTKFSNVNELEDFFTKCNVIIATMKIVSERTEVEIKKIADLCSHLFVDEAHHSKASYWDNFISYFIKGKVLLFTATPYRNDRQRLDGKIVFDFSLRKAQEQGYFRSIKFIPIREYDPIKADSLIAETAVSKLRDDRDKGFNHLLMARCENKERAKEIFKLYEKHNDLEPIVIYSGVRDKDEILKNIRLKKHKIIVCVDMLGEGFDLPELKVAAFHDIRKSLPITLQFAGRFTRTKYDEVLGEASFIANLYQPDVKSEIDQLYAQDADWNLLLPDLSEQSVQDQVEFHEFLSGFDHLEDSKIPFQNIWVAMSTVVYKTTTDTWNPRNYGKGIPNINGYDHNFHSINSNSKTLVVLLGKKVRIEWGNFNDVYNIEWDVVVAYWDSRNNLLFIHGSDKSGHFESLADAIMDGAAKIISGMDVFKAFHNINRVALFNVGLKKGLGRNLTFQSYFGRSVGDALSILQRSEGIKNNFFGVGYEEGDKVSLGCSQKGRIWSYKRGNLKDLVAWCGHVGKKLLNPNISHDTVLQGTLIPKQIIDRPVNAVPILADWPPELYMASEDRFEFRATNSVYNLSNCELVIINPSLNGTIQFAFQTEDINVPFELQLFENNENGQSTPDSRIVKLSDVLITVVYGTKQIAIEVFLNQNKPTIWFADGSFLYGNSYVKLTKEILPYDRSRIKVYNWGNVDIQKESQHVDPKIIDSIQYDMIQSLKQEDFNIIYDDDYSGEIADLITIKDHPNHIAVQFYHLKWAIDGRVGNDIKNLYEVCGQAQKSVHWKFKEGREFFDHLLRRIQKRRNGKFCSRLEKGSEAELEVLLNVAKRFKPIHFEINIVQPSISAQSASDEILLLLGVTSNYLKEIANIDLYVIGSA